MWTSRIALALLVWGCCDAWSNERAVDAAFNGLLTARDGTVAWQQCRDIMARYDASALAQFRIDGCSGAFVLYSQRAHLELQLGAADRALANGTQALAHASTTASRERLMWCIYVCAVAYDMMTNRHRASNPYWQWLRAFANENDVMRGVLAVRDAEELLCAHASNDAERVLAALLTRDRLIFPEAALMHARLARDRADYAEATRRYLACLRWHVWCEKGTIARAALAALDAMVPHMDDDLLAQYCTLRRTLPSRYPAMKRYGHLIAQLRVAAVNNPACIEQQLRDYEGEKLGVHLATLTNFAACLGTTGYEDTLDTYINHRTRIAIAIARYHLAHEAVEQGNAVLIQMLRFRVRVCTDSAGVLRLLTALRAGVSDMSSAQSNEYRQVLLQHLAYMDSRRSHAAQRAAGMNTHTATQEAYILRVKPAVMQALALLATEQ